MSKNNYGGNLVQKMGSKLSSTHFAQDAYNYSYYELSKDSEPLVIKLAHACLYILEGELICNDCKLSASEALLVSNQPIHLSTKSSCNFFLVGVKTPFNQEQSLQKFCYQELKLVSKPWGEEIWITGEHPAFCFKRIMIKKGTRTSLQFHHKKRETNFLYEGEVELSYLETQVDDLLKVKEADLSFTLLSAKSLIDVYPLVVHRLRAVTDIVLFEASTPEVDDVVRILDDAKRDHGRITAEHKK